MRYAGMRIVLFACGACVVSVLAAMLVLPGSTLPSALGLRMSGACLGLQLVRACG